LSDIVQFILPELDDFFIDYGQFWNLMTKLRPNCSIFWPELTCFLNRKVQFFWLIYNFYLLFVDCWTRINIFFYWNGQFTVQILSDIGQFFGRNRTIFLSIMVNFSIYRQNFVWYWSIFWPELDDFLSIMVNFSV